MEMQIIVLPLFNLVVANRQNLWSLFIFSMFGLNTNVTRLFFTQCFQPFTFPRWKMYRKFSLDKMKMFEMICHQSYYHVNIERKGLPKTSVVEFDYFMASKEEAISDECNLTSLSRLLLRNVFCWHTLWFRPPTEQRW